MNIINKIMSLFGSTDKQLIRGTGITTIILYLTHYIFEDGSEVICFNKIAAAFLILVVYFISEPLLRRKHNIK